MKNYDELVRRVKSRTNPESFPENRLFGNLYENEMKVDAPTKVLEYIKRSMDGVGEDYTRRSKEAGEMVKKNLKDCLSNVDYEYQGSVMTNTHIKGNSDIDLLAISNLSYGYDSVSLDAVLNNALEKLILSSSQLRNLEFIKNQPDYNGNSLNDLRKNRLVSEVKLESIYDECDISKPKSIRIKNKNLYREVDVAIAAWHKTLEAMKENSDNLRSIRIYDKELNSKGRVESPFVSIARINSKDASVNGRLKKMIRFLKNLKVDSEIERIDLNSFDLNAICYNISASNYSDKKYFELVIVLVEEFNRLISDESYRNSLKSVDSSEFIFNGKPNKIRALRELAEELGKVFVDFKFVSNLNYSI